MACPLPATVASTAYVPAGNTGARQVAAASARVPCSMQGWPPTVSVSCWLSVPNPEPVTLMRAGVMRNCRAGHGR
jgi:hypothetical protein